MTTKKDEVTPSPCHCLYRPLGRLPQTLRASTRIRATTSKRLRPTCCITRSASIIRRLTTTLLLANTILFSLCGSTTHFVSASTFHRIKQFQQSVHESKRRAEEEGRARESEIVDRQNSNNRGTWLERASDWVKARATPRPETP
ncbi:unnamed protein product, partial [Amoebophrya sp. A25]|eukprot:GSA25T00004913001.1